MGYRVIKILSEVYTLQEDATCNRKIRPDDKLVVKAQHMNFVQDYTKWYWKKYKKQKNIIVPTIDGNYWVISLIFKNMVIYPSVWRIMHYSRYPQFLQNIYLNIN